MWGRRLERIPKVRVPGQKEAVYCFDARKQRQKQAPCRTQTFQPLSAPRSPRPEPVQVFYRARPLNRPFGTPDYSPSTPLCLTPSEGVKVTQGRVLLQNVSPVRFDTAPPRTTSLSITSLPTSVACIPAVPTRMTLGPRTNSNSFSNPTNTSFLLSRQPAAQPLRYKSFPGPSFVDTLRGRPA